MRYFRHLFFTATLVLASPAAFGQNPKPVFVLNDGDRVALVGDTLIEREQSYGYVEERLTVHYPGKHITFRNLGWSADTPTGESRASFDFDKPGRGFELLKEEIASVQPTVVIVGYGMASSFKGEAGLPQFKANMNKLLDGIKQVCTNKAVRFVFVSPVRHEKLGAPLPDPTEHNKQLELYTKAIDEIATERKSPFISLYHNLMADGTTYHPPRPFTDDGIHLTAYGYLRMAESVEKRFVWEPNLWRVRITADGQVTPGSVGTKVTELERTKESAHWTALDDQLVSPFISGKEGRIPSANSPSLVQIDGLKSGTYELKADGIVVATGTDKEWGRGIAIERGPQFDQAEQLREAILKKNTLYFNRWRPQNETYLFGFRQYEQGQNAKEIPMFDPLITAQEAVIAKLSQPVPHNYELVAGTVPPAKLAKTGIQWPDKTNTPPPITPLPLPNFEVAPGFEISLYAEDPLLAKPIQMNFDPRGRLWVASSSVYPQIKPGQEADDKIILLEDTKGVGHVDKSSVFVEGLMTPTGVEPGDGGVYVGQNTQLLYFKDTDGDGKADEKRIVLSAFGTEDTHHIVHTLYWGQDGQLYFDQSIYIHSHIETPHGVERLNSGGIWHLRPPTMELGVYLRGFCNPWGHQFDAFGQSFVTDGAGGQGINFGVPGATYFTYAGIRRELKSVSEGSYPKFCGLEIIQSKQFPDDWQGNAITCDFRAHRVVRFAIEEKDSAYATREMPDLIRTTNVTFRPIDLKMGPDGALYIADWSNPIIQHGEVDFRDPRRDHEHGRIWRVTAKGRPLVPRPKLVEASNKELLNELLSPNKYNQQQARRVLTERGTNITADLARWTKAQKDDVALMQALWMYQSIDVVEPALLEKVLNAKDGRIRAAATRVVSYWHPRLKAPLDLLAQRVADAHPRVQIEALRALAEILSARSVELVLSVTDKPMDSFLDYAAWLSINDLAPTWVGAVKSGAWKSDGREKQLEFALKAIEPALAGEVLAQVIKDRTIPRDGTGPWIELIGQSGGATELRRIYDQTLSGGFDSGASARALKALSGAARERSLHPSGDLDSISTLFNDKDAKVRESAMRLAGDWKRASTVPRLLEFAGGKDERPAGRRVAFGSLREIGGQAVIQGLTPLTEKGIDPAVREEAVLALAALDVGKATAPVVDVLGEFTKEEDALKFWRSLLGVKGASAAVAKALPHTGLAPVMAKAGLRVAREGGRNETDLIVALTRGADLESQGLGLTDADMKQIATHVGTEGNAAKGEEIFRRKDVGCVNCHAIGGVGGKVGPDLTSIGASAQVDYLIESVFYPNRKIKEGYHSVLVETKDGEEYSGILVRENTEQLVLRDATDKENSIPKNNIKNRALGNSLMPSGLVDSLSSAQQLDLFRFLSELGKPGPYDASKGNVARFWKLRAATIDIAQFGDDKVLNGKLTDIGWTQAFSLVDGDLSKAELQGALDAVASRDPKSVYAAAQLQAAKAGTVNLKLAGADGAPTWVDGKPLGGSRDAKLTAGSHTIIIKLDAKKLPESIRLETSDGTFLVN